MKNILMLFLLFISGLIYADPKFSIGWQYRGSNSQQFQFEYLFKQPFSVFVKPSIYVYDHDNSAAIYNAGLGIGAGRYINIVSKDNFSCNIIPYIMPSFNLDRHMEYIRVFDSLGNYSKEIEAGLDTINTFEIVLGILPEFRIYHNIGLLIQPLEVILSYNKHYRAASINCPQLYEIWSAVGGIKFYF